SDVCSSDLAERLAGHITHELCAYRGDHIEDGPDLRPLRSGANHPGDACVTSDHHHGLHGLLVLSGEHTVGTDRVAHGRIFDPWEALFERSGGRGNILDDPITHSDRAIGLITRPRGVPCATKIVNQPSPAPLRE